MKGEIALGGGKEFDLIRAMRSRWGNRASGIGDDAAILEVPAGERLVVSTDASIENVHFRRDWLTPEEIGYRAATSALSDLAAMAATPFAVLVALSMPEEWVPDLPAIADGIGEAASIVGAQIVGGDLTRASELAIGVTVLGHAQNVLSRSGASVGDSVFVTGTFGGPASAVLAFEHGETPGTWARERFARPQARIREARWLADHGARAAIDISDGLLADLAHIARASGVRITVDLDALPVGEGMDAIRAASGGEEYELAIAAPIGLEIETFTREFGLQLSRIGAIEAGDARVDVTYRGDRVAPPVSWNHFSH
ncbi:MAG: thiamine-phosphate kinase [Anaerolineae bacterium]|nr:thiamine-phosphate kinase [Gemmatimonadaceae bacterium]